MYIGYITDRKKLGFSCIQDFRVAKQISNLKNLIKRTGGVSVAYIVKEGKQISILLISKEVLVGVLIFVKAISVDIDPYVYHPSASSPKVYRYCVSKSNNLRFLTSPSPILDPILKLKGGSDELNVEEQEKLVKSIVSKTDQSSDEEISINKFLEKLLKLMDPVISDQRFWRLISESQKPIESELSVSSEVRSTDILSPAQKLPENRSKNRSKSSSSIFAEAFPTPQARKKLSSLPPMEKSRLSIAQTSNEDSFSNGLSGNHEELSKNIKDNEIKTRLRRAEPLYPSEVLGDSYQYGGKQLERKAPPHLKDFGISTEGKTVKEMATEYHDCIENLLQQPGLVVREDGTLGKWEPTINIGDPESRIIVVFEKNPLYDKNHFISSYLIASKAFDDFEETGNIGLSPKERQKTNDQLQRTRAQAERERTTARSFYSNLPEDARIGNKQLREVETLQQQLKEDPSFSLTENQKDLLQRVEKYQQYKQEFYQKNPTIDRDEL